MTPPPSLIAALIVLRLEKLQSLRLYREAGKLADARDSKGFDLNERLRNAQSAREERAQLAFERELMKDWP